MLTQGPDVVSKSEQDEQMYSEEDDNNRDAAYMDKNFRSSTRKLLINSKNEKSSCADILH